MHRLIRQEMYGRLGSKRVVHYSILTKCLAVGPEDFSLLLEGQSDFETDCTVSSLECLVPDPTSSHLTPFVCNNGTGLLRLGLYSS
jgi:hypothetical protein